MNFRESRYLKKAEKFYKKELYLKAIKFYMKAIKFGSLEAKNRMGDCYYNGYGVKRDYQKAFELYQEAEKLNNGKVKSDLGKCYYNGHGVKQNYKKAFELYEEAYELGSLDAIVGLGDCYCNGHGVKQNYKKAFELYKKAYKHGSKKAASRLGDYYYNSYNKGNQSLEFIKVAAKLYDEADEYKKAGDCYFELFKKRSSEKDFIRHKDVFPLSHELSYLKAHSHYNKVWLYNRSLGCESLGDLYSFIGFNVHKEHGDWYLKEAVYYYKTSKTFSSKIKLFDLCFYNIRHNKCSFLHNKEILQEAYEEIRKIEPILAERKIKKFNDYINTERTIIEYKEDNDVNEFTDSYISKEVSELYDSYPKKSVVAIDNVSELPVDEIDQNLYGAIIINPKYNTNKVTNTIYSVENYVKCVNRLNEILEGIPNVNEEKSNVEDIIHMVCKRLANNITYNYDEKNQRNEFNRYTSRNMIDGLLKGTAVCAGISEILRNALALKGIEAINVFSETHAFTMVNVNGKWRYLDLTFDLSRYVSGENLKYFLLSYDEFATIPPHIPTADMVIDKNFVDADKCKDKGLSKKKTVYNY